VGDYEQRNGNKSKRQSRKNECSVNRERIINLLNLNVQQISITQPTGKKNNMLVERISRIELEIFLSVSDYEKLNMIFYESDNNKKYPIIQNDFKRIKLYLRILRNKYYFPEFIYALEFLKKKIEEINDDLVTEKELENYDQYLYDFEPIKNKELINDFLLKFIVRYNDYSVKNNKTEFIEFQKRLNLEVLKSSIKKIKAKKRIIVLNKYLQLINNEISFGNKKNIFFISYDSHIYSNRFNFETLEDKKEVFENELNLIKLKDVINTKTKNSKHENIFSNNGFILFEYLLNEHIRPKGTTGRFSDIAHYYWKMYNSEIQYIHQRPEAFKTWFLLEYNKEDIGQIKTATNLKNTNRDKHYSNSLDWFKSQNK
jgi:hypothetical protein